MKGPRLLLGLVASLLPAVLFAQRIESSLDEWGNPIGDGFSLASDGEFRGKRLVAWSADGEVHSNIFPENNPLWAALKAKGFDVQIRSGPFDPQILNGADQFWLFSGRSSGMNEEGYAAVVEFVKRGKGLYLVSDNEPYLQESAVLAGRLFEAGVTGNYMGDKIIAVRGKGMTKDDFSQSELTTGARSQTGGGRAPGSQSSITIPPGGGRMEVINRVSHYVEDHALLTGINYLYEGITISRIVPSSQLHVVLTASDGQPLAAVATDAKRRVVVDCGWTRYYVSFINKTAGTNRYAENIAAFLMGKSGKVDVASLHGNALGLLDALETSGDAKNRQKIADALQKTSPTYSEVKDQIGVIQRLAGSDDRAVAAAARAQLVNAFQRAPISHCLYWLGRGDSELAELIWQQLDGRIARADAARRTQYAESALAVLEHDGFNSGAKAAAVDLLARLKAPQSTDPLVEMLLELPREVWPEAGQLLRDLTGQDFGPRGGDTIAEVLAAQKQWQAWRKQQP